MAKDRFKTGLAPVIRVEKCGSDLIVRGWQEPALQIKGNYTMQDDEKGYRLSAEGSLELNIPTDAGLFVDEVGGDLIVKRVTAAGVYGRVLGDAMLVGVGDATIDNVQGDFVVRKGQGAISVAEVHGDAVVHGATGAVLQAVHGDLSVRHIDGDLSINTIQGDAELRNVNNVTIGQGLRDVNLAHVGGRLVVHDIAGDIRLRGGLGEGNHSLEAEGDIIVRWPVERPLQLTATARRIDNRLALADVVEKDGSLVGRMGEGGARLAIVAGRRVVLKEMEVGTEKWADGFGGNMEFEFHTDMAGLAARIEAEVNQHVNRLSREFGPDFAEKVARKAEKAAERARRHAGPRGRVGGFDFATPSTPRASSSEEQLKILKMVETGKISPEEANMLLAALEA
jgi:hypothetical protein